VKCNDFLLVTRCHAVTLTFDPLTLKICGTSSVTCSWSVVNLSQREVEQSPTELLMIWLIFAPVTSRYDLDLCPLDLELTTYNTSAVLCLNTVQNLSEVE